MKIKIDHRYLKLDFDIRFTLVRKYILEIQCSLYTLRPARKKQGKRVNCPSSLEGGWGGGVKFV